MSYSDSDQPKSQQSNSIIVGYTMLEEMPGTNICA